VADDAILRELNRDRLEPGAARHDHALRRGERPRHLELAPAPPDDARRDNDEKKDEDAEPANQPHGVSISVDVVAARIT
jgi:hypothetical protein